MYSPRWLWLVAVLTLVFCASPVLAGLSSWMPGVLTQSRVIHVCIVVVCVALFIMLKKFSSR